jgi:GntR family transcriptional regulator
VVPQLKFRRVAADLVRKIESGELPAGARLPNELELIETYGESRNTIRDAIYWLVLREFVERKPGQGTFVRRRIKPIVTTLSQDPETNRAGGDASGAYHEYLDFLERRRERAFGTEPGVPHLIAEPRKSDPSVELGPAPDYVAERLLVAPGDPVVRRYQEFWVDQTPWSVQATYYPFALVDRGAKDLMKAKDFSDGELAYIAESTGLNRCGYRVRILFRKATVDEAKFFQLPGDDSVHVVSLIRTAYEDRGDGPCPFRANFTVFPGDRHQFVINSGTFPDEPAAPARDS